VAQRPSSALILAVLIGIFPRTLERALRFEEPSRTKNSIKVVMTNGEYIEKDHEMSVILTENERKT
jgi:hypothetical protein